MAAGDTVELLEIRSQDYMPLPLDTAFLLVTSLAPAASASARAFRSLRRSQRVGRLAHGMRAPHALCQADTLPTAENHALHRLPLGR
jgi:hypothetical protein